jgi:hypothetical protein
MATEIMQVTLTELEPTTLNFSEYVPAVVSVHPRKDESPEIAETVSWLHVNCPPEGPEPIETVTAPATGWSALFTIATTGWTEKALPPVAPLGATLTLIALAAVSITVRGALTVDKFPSVAVKVKEEDARSREHPEKVATPLVAVATVHPKTADDGDDRLNVTTSVEFPTSTFPN